MMEVLWRVDNDLLTLESVSEDNFNSSPPIGCWLPVIYGNGSYAYFETLAEAKKVYLNLLNDKLVTIQKMIKYAETIKEGQCK